MFIPWRYRFYKPVTVTPSPTSPVDKFKYMGTNIDQSSINVMKIFL